MQGAAFDLVSVGQMETVAMHTVWPPCGERCAVCWINATRHVDVDGAGNEGFKHNVAWGRCTMCPLLTAHPCNSAVGGLDGARGGRRSARKRWAHSSCAR